MATINLSDGEWQQILNILGDVPWRISNPLLMKIGEQLQRQQQPASGNSGQMPATVPTGETDNMH